MLIPCVTTWMAWDVTTVRTFLAVKSLSAWVFVAGQILLQWCWTQHARALRTRWTSASASCSMATFLNGNNLTNMCRHTNLTCSQWWWHTYFSRFIITITWYSLIRKSVSQLGSKLECFTFLQSSAQTLSLRFLQWQEDGWYDTSSVASQRPNK